VFDEILDMNLDDDGVNSVVNILNNIANDSSVFIVSHKEEYKEKFSDVLKVYMDGNGFTKIVA
jgi:DNA repair exonuclease SbcCD ATPase subunit